MRLLTRLLLQVVAPFMLGAVIVLLAIGFSLEAKLRAEILDAAAYTLGLRTQSIDSNLNNIRRNLRLLAATDIVDPEKLARLQTHLPQWKNQLPEAEALFFFTLDGKAYDSEQHIIDVSDRDYIEKMRRGEALTTSVLISRASGQQVVLFAEPVLDAAGKPIGALGVTITLERITSWVRELKPTTGGAAILIDAQGALLVGHPEEASIAGSFPDPLRAPRTAAIVKAFGASTSGRIDVGGGYGHWQILQRDIGSNGWKLALAFPEQTLFGLVNRVWTIGFWIIFVFTLGTVFIVYLFNRSLLHPIRQLATAQQQLENGDLAIRINNESRDELGQLSRSFDHMAARLNNALHDAQEAEEKFRCLFENANDAIFLLDGNRFIECNPYTLALFHCNREQLLAQGPLDLSPSHQADGRSTAAAGQVYIEAALFGEAQFFPWIHLTADGQPFNTEVSLKRIVIHDQVLLQAIVRDVTARDRAEAQTRALETKFQRVFAASVDYMIVARLRDGMIVEANDGFGELTGYPPSETIGKTVLALGIWEDAKQRLEFVRQLEAHGKVQEYPMILRRRDGALREVSVSVATFDLGGEAHYVSIARDVTDEKALQRALLASEARLKTIIDTTPTAVCINRLSDGCYLSVNPAWEVLYGVTAEEAIGKTITECCITIQAPDALRQQTKRLLKQGHIENEQAEFITPLGHRVSIIYSSRIVELDGETVMISINSDITRLKETEKRLKAIIESAPAMIVITRLADFTYIEVNPEFERLFGCSNQQVRGKTIEQAGFAITDPVALREQTIRLLAAGRIDNAQAEFVTPEGKHISIIYSSRITELDGEPVMLSMSANITHIKEVEAGLRQAKTALQESKERFIALFQSSPIALSVSVRQAPDYQVSELNAAWYRSFGYSADAVIGRRAAEFSFWDRPDEHAFVIDSIEANGEIREYEAWLRHQDGSLILCSISAQRMVVGNHTLLLAAYVDITEKRRIEQEIRDLNATLESRIQQRTQELQQAQAEIMRSEKFAALGSLVAGVAHELNTPIGTSLTVATTLTDRTRAIREQLLSGMRRSALEDYLADSLAGSEILSRNLQRAAELIQSFKSIAVDQASDQRRTFDLRQIIEETLNALRPSLKKKPYSVNTVIEDGLEINSYAGSLEQVVVNLINNAVLHGFEGRDSGTISIHARPLDAQHIRLQISDNGCGIPAANLARIFDPFFTTKLGKGGSGLGLHIVRNIIEDILGGRITASSEVGRGTIMTLDLPRQAPDLKPVEC